jgi:hypothetical protein
MAAVPLLGGCAGAAPTRRDLAVAAGERTRVGYVLVASNQVLMLQNASAAAPVDVYKDKDSPAGLKVIGDVRMQALLDVLASNEFFARAGSVAAGGSKEILYVEQGTRRWVLSRRPRPADSEDAIANFNTVKTYMLSVYNDTTAFQNREFTAEDLKRERERIEQGGKDAKAKAAKAGPGGNDGIEQPRSPR